jgi:putative colanic acid biosynthesis glycosyltransferase
MRLLQINTTVNTGSTGRIAEDIGKVMLGHGHESYIASGRFQKESLSELIKVGNHLDFYAHGVRSLLFDQQGQGSRAATSVLVETIGKVNPDLIGLHNLHGYYLNSEVLFKYLRRKATPIVWTLHDCWPFTGHCAHFDFVGCNKWQTHCEKCPLTSRYPKSLFIDNSRSNFDKKKELFTSLTNMTLVTPSQWLKRQVEKSFLGDYKVHVINNGIDLDVFKVLKDDGSNRAEKKVILGVASTWDRIKGLKDFIVLRSLLPASYDIVLIGLNKKQIESLPEGITGIERTESQEALVKWYNRADVFVNPTYVDNFPTTNLEALACGTPVVTYDAGGSPEAIDSNTGLVVAKGKIDLLKEAIEELTAKDKKYYRAVCRSRAEALFNKHDRFEDYLALYEQLLNK